MYDNRVTRWDEKVGLHGTRYAPNGHQKATPGGAAIVWGKKVGLPLKEAADSDCNPQLSSKLCYS